MENKDIQKKNNGFTLIELIVTVAIMVVLVGILSVVVIGYIDKAKIAKDVQAADELSRAVRRSIVLNEDNIQDDIVKGSISANVSWNSANATITDSVDSSQEENTSERIDTENINNENIEENIVP